jgi:hypothetical protein
MAFFFPSLSILGAKNRRSLFNWRVRSVLSPREEGNRLAPREEGKRLDPINLPISSNVIGCSHLVRRRRDAS